MIYVYGDSHAPQFRGVEDIRVFSTNSVSMHTLTTLGPEAYIKDGRPAVLVFGEIDCRCLIWPQIYEKGRDFAEVISDLAERYIALAKSLPGRVILVSVTPASDIVKDGMDGYPGWQPGFWKRQGTLRDRMLYTFSLNRIMKQSGLPFLDIHDHYADAGGQLRFDVTQDGVHICPTKNGYMVEELRRML